MKIDEEEFEYVSRRGASTWQRRRRRLIAGVEMRASEANNSASQQ